VAVPNKGTVRKEKWPSGRGEQQLVYGRMTMIVKKNRQRRSETVKGCAAVTWVENRRVDVVGWGEAGIPPLVLHPRSCAMSVRPVSAATMETREQRIEGIMKELRPKVEEAVRQMVERAVEIGLYRQLDPK